MNKKERAWSYVGATRPSVMGLGSCVFCISLIFGWRYRIFGTSVLSDIGPPGALKRVAGEEEAVRARVIAGGSANARRKSARLRARHP